MNAGRFAPSPSGELHVGNLRTAVLAWCFARRSGRSFIVRMEDLTTEAPGDHARSQIDDLAALGIRSDVPVVFQSERLELYRGAISALSGAGLTYECWCTRREIREAVRAPHGANTTTAYPGTCARLGSAERARRAASGRPAAIRLRAGGESVEVHDGTGRTVRAEVDDFVLQRGDGMPAYNLAVVVDDADQGVDQVVRGDDLLATTPRQVLLTRLLGLREPSYLHVPLVVGPDGERLAKRHGAVTLAQLRARGVDEGRLLGMLAESLGVPCANGGATLEDIRGAIDPENLGAAWEFDPTSLDTTVV